MWLSLDELTQSSDQQSPPDQEAASDDASGGASIDSAAEAGPGTDRDQPGAASVESFVRRRIERIEEAAARAVAAEAAPSETPQPFSARQPFSRPQQGDQEQASKPLFRHRPSFFNRPATPQPPPSSPQPPAAPPSPPAEARRAPYEIQGDGATPPPPSETPQQLRQESPSPQEAPQEAPQPAPPSSPAAPKPAAPPAPEAPSAQPDPTESNQALLDLGVFMDDLEDDVFVPPSLEPVAPSEAPVAQPEQEANAQLQPGDAQPAESVEEESWRQMLASHTASPEPELDTKIPAVADEAAPAEDESPDLDLGSEDDFDAAASGSSFSMLSLRDRVVIMLLFNEVLREVEVAKAWDTWKEEGASEPLWRVLLRDASMDHERIYAEAAQVYAFEEADFSTASMVAFIKDLQEAFSDEQWARMQQLRVVPVAQYGRFSGKENRLIFVTHDPTNPEISRFLHSLKLERSVLQYMSLSRINEVIGEAFEIRNEYLERINDDHDAFDLGTTYEEDGGLVDEDQLDAEINRSKLINLFEATLVEAVRRGVSDVHILPNALRQIEIHFRVDGELRRWQVEERTEPEAFLAVVKDNATNIDRFERDARQDGFIQRRVDGTLIRFRVSVLPIANANQDIRSESIVIRVLDDRKVVTDLTKLGLLENALERFNHAIRQPHGMVILTGPTGSGKSTTLFAALYQVITPKVNVLTVEDPIEYVIPGVRQIKIGHKLDLEDAVRGILRHDPDIVMVGEMRDRATAELAIKLANTGHLTFSTLHTNDAASAVSRLYKMGIEPFLIAYAINLVVAQRLIRRICPDCKKPDPKPDTFLLGRLGFTQEEIETMTFYIPSYDRSCKTCKGVGYKGRRAICEALYFSPEIRQMIVEAGETIDEESIANLAIKQGMLTLQASAREVVKLGDTSIEEMMRITASEA